MRKYFVTIKTGMKITFSDFLFLEQSQVDSLVKTFENTGTEILFYPQ